jgi:hypothetical protein
LCKGEGRREKGKRRKKKGERKKEKGEKRKEEKILKEKRERRNENGEMNTLYSFIRNIRMNLYYLRLFPYQFKLPPFLSYFPYHFRGLSLMERVMCLRQQTVYAYFNHCR